MVKRSLSLCLVILTLVLAAFCADPPPYKGPSEEDVIELDSTNLESTIYESEDAWLIDLYAYWCDHCQKLRPEWAKLATQMKGVAKVAKIDASQNRQFDQLFGLKGYPHVVMVPAGKRRLIQVPRTRKYTTLTRVPGLPTPCKSGPNKK